jgi:formate dehydrogenase subunit delta
MSHNQLVTMANNIAAFFAADPDREAAIEGVAQHLRNFWEPRMRQAILAHLGEGGEGLDPLVIEALARLQPKI